MTAGVETKRGRVRRLVLEPLAELGWIRPKGMKAGAHAEELVRLSDDLTYMSELSLGALCDMLRSKAQGKARNEWPRRGTILHLAEVVQPRPVEEMPNLVSWFRSVEGPRADREGVLVREFLFFEKFKRPPLNDGDRRLIRDRTRDDEHLRLLVAEGRVPDEQDAAKLRWLDNAERRVRAIMEQDKGQVA